MNDLSKYKGTLPYSSELFGIFQPLIGWRSGRTHERFSQFRANLYRDVAARLVNRVQQAGVTVQHLQPFAFAGRSERKLPSSLDSGVARLVQKEAGENPPADWNAVAGEQRIGAFLDQIQQSVSSPSQTPAVQAMLQKEAVIGGFLSYLAKNSPDSLDAVFFNNSPTNPVEALGLVDPLLSFGTNNYDAILSPIGIIHLYREYFFEFDSFLGPPVGHIWLSPGGTVELVEVSTRKAVTERAFESTTETVAKSETSQTTQDELSDAIKDENRDNIKFGFTNEAHVSTPWFQDTATASYSLDSAKARSRETTHKQMRQQSEKLSSEIKRSFKTTFKTSTEITDTTSKRYVIQNTSQKLVNYELRRKMRKVGVQVQDIGTQLCWQTFVDDPGRHLGIAKLVHIAQPPDLANSDKQPKGLDLPGILREEGTITIPFVLAYGYDDASDHDVSYNDGKEGGDDGRRIRWTFSEPAFTKNPGYTLVDVGFDPQGAEAILDYIDLKSAEGSSQGSYTARLRHVHFHGADSLRVKTTLTWKPTDAYVQSIKDQNAAAVSQFSNEQAQKFKEAFYKSARDRIKLASGIGPRPAEDLREEERISVYRRLIDQLFHVGTHETKHVTSELIRSIFDVDKLLYFVAPEWWQPRMHRSGQHLGEAEVPANMPAAPGSPGDSSLMGLMSGKDLIQVGVLPSAVVSQSKDLYVNVPSQPHTTSLPSTDIVDWGGAKEIGRDNYYITEESVPARLGSSLGWLMQLDGDTFRNAFLNAPWVKAVIPIRPGKEKAAINWLQQANVEGSDGLKALYVADPGEPPEIPGDPPELQSNNQKKVTLSDALDYLIGEVRKYNKNARTTISAGANPADPNDPHNHFAGSLPTEAVFEHGFYPLQGGVKFNQNGTEQTFVSQWMEILPTDQVVALSVEYDPKTLQLKVPE